MADETSFSALKRGIAADPKAPAPSAPRRGKYYESFVDFIADEDFYKGAHKNEIPYGAEPWRGEMQEGNRRDLDLQRETQAKQQRIKAAGAPHLLVAMAGEDGEVRDYLIGLIDGNGDVSAKG
ncbi:MULTISPECIES: hypothetical protein [unclassified Mesorhizobium]|uniref:hypothetical protein n=1 Tax=unclassified Mesorhizobium TaxID=325217 RepID=UPI0003CF4A1A|nr:MULTISPECIES: hypothetical protein [unclassified Mesorhizobium]ESY21735.1 hypothetical protein X751_05660 [Mesorhizobium sp. LNJC395A00]WJI72870.1 hypothetical protein NLY37_17695 [Mesorhizobium sp. C395A]